MKWFVHETTASEDVKIVRLELEHGISGYAVFFKLLELVGREGDDSELKFSKYPKELMAEKFRISKDSFLNILSTMGELGLVCKDSLKKGSLHIPNMGKRADDYTKRVQREAVNNQRKEVSLDKERQSWFEILWKQYPDKVRKKESMRHFGATVKSPEDFAKIKKALFNYLNSRRVHSGYVQNASTWFNNWQDWVEYTEDVYKRSPEELTRELTCET